MYFPFHRSSPLRMGAFIVGTGVLMGAFGTHALVDVVTPERLAMWETAVFYQMVHGIGIALIGIVLCTPAIAGLCTVRVTRVALYLFTGVTLFSGSLYLMVLLSILGRDGASLLGVVTPIGGVFLVFGWAALAFAVPKEPSIYTAALEAEALEDQ